MDEAEEWDIVPCTTAYTPTPDTADHQPWALVGELPLSSSGELGAFARMPCQAADVGCFRTPGVEEGWSLVGSEFELQNEKKKSLAERLCSGCAALSPLVPAHPAHRSEA